ncbi:MAG TPA: alpha/beta fold hydrolase [Mycobacteriales bacterium]|nr:alpha/beta fold hydrolase [Mycobacteriales bacterium]
MRRLVSVLAPAIALLAALVGPVPSARAPAAAAAVIEPRPVDIPVRDGVTLKGTALEPADAGPHPAVVLISPWGTPDTIYLAQSAVLARRGYVVLSYTTRGFGASGGTVSLAGPTDLADVSDVLDWMVAHTGADPQRIGVGGVSYGAGISLLAAGHDPRIKAVIAMSGWTDLTETFYRGQTRAFQVLGSVRFFVEATGRPSPDLVEILTDFFADRDRRRILEWTRVRSAVAYLDRINAHRPAIFLAQAYGDTFFPPNQIVDFFAGLTGPKRLELSPGDHGTPESSGLLGMPNPLWTDAGNWLDQYVAGLPTGVGGQNPVLLRGLPSDPVETYPDWAHVSTHSDRYALGRVRTRDGTGDLALRAPRAGWRRSIDTGVPTTADAGFVVLTNSSAALTGIPVLLWLPTVDRRYAGVWTSTPLDRAAAMRGIAHLRLETRRQRAGTVIAYLYDVNSLGIGRLIAHQPRTWRRGARTLDLAFPPVSYDLPEGSRLALVVDTVDPLYGDQGPREGRLQFTAPSWLDIPVR